MKIGDFVVLAAGLLLVAGVTAGAIQKGKQADDSDMAIITCRGEQYLYSLSKDQKITLQGNIGISELEIKDGTIFFTSSPCRDHICENMGHAGVETGIHFIACLPNDVVVYVDGDSHEKNDLDY